MTSNVGTAATECMASQPSDRDYISEEKLLKKNFSLFFMSETRFDFPYDLLTERDCSSAIEVLVSTPLYGILWSIRNSGFDVVAVSLHIRLSSTYSGAAHLNF